MYSTYRKTELLSMSKKLGIIFDVMVVGVTGAGKSTTLNMLFQKEVAKVGRGVDPETMELDSYMLSDIFRFWDTPGLGDSISRDERHTRLLIDLLYKDYDTDKGWVDLVLVVIEGSNRDMGTTYKLLNEIIVPNFPKDRILVAINQADVAMKGHFWDYDLNKPTNRLLNFLNDQALSVQKRIEEATGVNIQLPICYSAEKNWNIDKFLDLIIDNIPSERRRLVI